jgi:Ca2+-binding EF-hand superfamily protein
LVLISSAYAEEKTKGGPKHNLEAVFKKLDTDNDGQLSMDEFKKLADLGKGKLKEKPGLLVKMFHRLDTNKDGSLSLAEFKKLGELRHRKGNKGAGKSEESEQ